MYKALARREKVRLNSIQDSSTSATIEECREDEHFKVLANPL